jgi:predicted transcriptional regulator
MLLVPVVKRRMNIIKQHGKRKNVHQRPPNILQLSKNNKSKNIIKIIFNVNLNHNLIRVYVKESFDAKRDGLTTSKG